MNRSAVVFFALFGLALGGAIIGNGKVILGVDNLGQLNIPYKAVTFADGGVPLPNTDPAGVRVVGLRLDEYPFPPSTEPGCVCEGWGAKYVINGVSTYKAGVDNAAGVFGASLVSFTGTDGANIATSVVSLTGGAKVTHVFRTSPNPNIYRVVITVENPSTVPYTSFIYRRQMDWDIYPTQFNEFVTIRGAAGHPKLDSSCDDGFVGGDVDTRRCISVPGGFKQNFEWSGPADHGAYFDFQVGPIAAGKSVTFTMYYGVGKTYTETDNAINSLPLEVLSYGASNLGGRPNLNSYVFAWGFSGTGGETITKPPFTVVAPDDYTVECGSAVVRADPTFFGNCDDQPLTSLTSSETITAGSCVSNYVITRTFTGTDRCGKTSTVSQKITVRDTTAPVITAPSTAVYECGSTASVSATASDTCGAATLTFVDTATTPASCVGTGFNRVFTARDACGNTATATTVVTSRDTTAPTLTIPANIEVDCSGSTATASTGTATATDSCSTPTVTYSDVVSGSGCPRTISRTWTAVDKCGNRVTGTQTITVRPFCGDGVAQGAEQCDLGATNGAYGSCCTSTCTFAATTTVCRNSAGLCDIVEYCSGTTSSCPADTVKPNGTPCGEFFGMCDVSLEKSCTGTSPSCAGPPAFPGFPEVNASWTDYNVISFNQFQVSGGDVEGRLAVRNKATLSGFTLGLELRLETDSWRKHSLFVAGDASWTDGSLHPDGTNVGASGPAASAYVGGVASFPAYLASRLDTTVPFTAAAASSGFDTLKAYYQGIQSQLSSIPTNVAATVQYTNGLLLTCSETSDFYHVTIPAAVFSSTHWTELRNCKFTAAWVVDITGNDDVVIQGQPFPAIVERVIYNVLGTNTVRGATGVAGNILAPNSNYDMPSGVTYGVLVAGNVTFARQNNKPNCLVYNPVTLATKTSKPIRVGDSTIWMVSLPSFIAGDRVCVNGDCKKVIGGESRDIDGDGVVDHGIVVDTVFAVSHPADSFATAVVENPSAADRSAPLPEVSGGEDNKQGSSSAVTLTISMALIAILALFF